LVESENAESMNRPLIIFGAVIAGLLIFALGVVLSLPKMTQSASPSPTPRGIAGAKPGIDESRKTPGPDPTPNLPTRPAELPPGQNWGWVIHEGAKVHETAGLNSPVAATLRYGKRVRLLESEEGWQKILMGRRKVGYLQSQFIGEHRPSDAPADDPAEANQTLRQFFQEITSHHLGAAYDLLSFEFKRDLSYATFQGGYADTEQALLKIVRVQTVSPEKFAIDSELMMIQERGNHAYRGTYEVILEQGEWKISRADIREVDVNSIASPAEPIPSGSPTPKSGLFADPMTDSDDY
jgi:hypothetical protein